MKVLFQKLSIWVWDHIWSSLEGNSYGKFSLVAAGLGLILWILPSLVVQALLGVLGVSFLYSATLACMLIPVAVLLRKMEKIHRAQQEKVEEKENDNIQKIHSSDTDSQ